MMDDFELTDQQKAFQTLAREFAEGHIKPIAVEIDRMEVKIGLPSFPWDMIKEAHKIGLKTLALPKEYGGMEADHLTQVVIADELAFVDVSCSKTISQCWKIPVAWVIRTVGRAFVKSETADDYKLCSVNEL